MTAALTRDQQDALEIARQLAAAGIPIFPAYPDSNTPTGYRLPPKWQHTIPDPAVVDTWSPGMALCAVMGHGLDLLDIDPRNGGDLAALGGVIPISYGSAATPSGGLHSFIKSLNVRSRDKVVAGIDIKAGDSTGEGRGFAYIAPTVRASKADGVKRAYQWLVPLDVHRLSTEGPHDDSGKALVQLINAKRNGHHPTSSGVPTPGEFMQGRPWDNIERTLAEGRNNGTHKLASALRGKGGYALEDAIEIMYNQVWPRIETAPGDHPFTQTEFETAIRSAWRYQDGAEQRTMEDINDAEAAKTLSGPTPLNGHNGAAVETQRASDADFWESRNMLTNIRDFALSRRASPWATLGVVLVRVIATIPPRVVLPPLVGGVASLNLFVALVGNSGSGKGAAIAAATDAVGLMANFATHTVGSGQGIAHGFAHRERGEGVVRHAHSVIFLLEEIDHLVGLTGQTGSTLLPELRRVWMGERLGHLFVDPNKRLEIEQHTYRAGLIAGVQPGRAGVLLNDSEGGTPQRFLWLPATYPHPDQRPDEPKIRHWTPPRWQNDPHPPTDPQGPALPVIPRVTLPIPDCAKMEIDAALLARARGQVHALDGHRLLCQLKVAAALGILDRRSVVSKEDWQLAEQVMAYSDVVRDRVIGYLSTQASEQNQAKARLEADRAVMVADAVEDGAVARVARSIMRILTRADGWLSHKQLRTTLAARDRGYFDTALEHLLAAGQVQPEPTQRGSQYRAVRGDDGAQ